jgi:hypothetical protein
MKTHGRSLLIRPSPYARLRFLNCCYVTDQLGRVCASAGRGAFELRAQIRKCARAEKLQTYRTAVALFLCTGKKTIHARDFGVFGEKPNEGCIFCSRPPQQLRRCVCADGIHGNFRLLKISLRNGHVVKPRNQPVQPLTQRPSIIRRLVFAKTKEANRPNHSHPTQPAEQNFPPSPHDPMLTWEIRSTKHEIRNTSQLKNALAVWSACSPLPLFFAVTWYRDPKAAEDCAHSKSFATS